MLPLLTASVHAKLRAALDSGDTTVSCSLDLERSQTRVSLGARSWEWQGKSYPYLQRCRERTIYYWTGSTFEVAARYSGALVKLVPTRWGPPGFEIDGIKMLPSEHIDPYEDAARKVALVQPAGKSILDTCGGLGYFAACCHRAGAASVHSYEKSEDVLWIRSLNPW